MINEKRLAEIEARLTAVEAHVGGGLLYVRQNPEHGHITDFVPRFKTFFDREFSMRVFDV